MNLRCFGLSDFPYHLAAGCFDVSLLVSANRKVMCRCLVSAEGIVAKCGNRCLSESVRHFCIYPLLFSFLFVFTRSHGQFHDKEQGRFSSYVSNHSHTLHREYAHLSQD